MLQALLFDMDGILADSEPMWNQIDAAMLREHGVSYSGEHKDQVLGVSFPIALQFYLTRYELRTTIEEMALRRTSIAHDFYANRIPLFPDATRVLEHAKSLNLRLALATSSVGAFVRPFLERHDLPRFFDAIITGEEVQHGKPAPDIYLQAAQKIGVAPAHCLVVEDALAGVQAGKSAGARVVAIPDARFIDPALYGGKADFQLGDLSELPQLVARLARES